MFTLRIHCFEWSLAHFILLLLWLFYCLLLVFIICFFFTLFNFIKTLHMQGEMKKMLVCRAVGLFALCSLLLEMSRSRRFKGTHFHSVCFMAQSKGSQTSRGGHDVHKWHGVIMG